MSGRDAQRGFIFQTLIAMIECLNKDKNSWDAVKLEPDTDTDKIDILLYFKGNIVSAIQVKSSINNFYTSNVRTWHNELKKTVSGGAPVLLYLVGGSSKNCSDYIKKNKTEIKTIPFFRLEEYCIGSLVKYIQKVASSNDVNLKNLNQIEASLFSMLHKNSIREKPLTRDDFEQAFCSVVAVQFYDYMINVFLNEKEEHPSIKMMNQKPLLFPKRFSKILSDGRNAVENKEAPRTIKEIILESWKPQAHKHILLIGEGGIGKTVAMLTLPEEDWFKKLGIPVIYVPLQSLDKYEGDLDRYLEVKFGADNYNRIIKLANRIPDGHPGLMLLLDGFNEIPDVYKKNAGKYIKDWMMKPGIQIITTSRFVSSLENCCSKYRLQHLPYDAVRSFLLSEGIKEESLPKESDRISKVINLPLMLAIYTHIEKVKEESDRFPASWILDWKEPSNAAHIIWDYLQIELYRSIERDDPYHSVMQYSIAILAIAPYICCQMCHQSRFYIKQGEIIKLIREALVYYASHERMLSSQILNVREEFDRFQEEDLLQAAKAAEYARILIDNTALFQRQRNRAKGNENIERIDYSYSLMHQNFRDALAAFFICSCLITPACNKEKKALLNLSDYYIKNYMAEHFSNEELVSIWNQYREEGSNDGHITYILLDLIGRQRNYDYREIDFSEIDLTKTNLHGLLSRRLDICPLPIDNKKLHNTKISINCFMPNGHGSIVHSLAFSPDNRYLVSGAKDGTVRIWDPESGECRVLKGHSGGVNSVAYSPDGRNLASGADDGTVRIWNPESGECNDILNGHRGRVFSVAYSPDGKYLASGADDGTVRIWNSESGKCINLLNEHGIEFYSVAYSPDGCHIAIGANDGSIRIWNPSRKKCSNLKKGHMGWVISVTYRPDGTQLASGAVDGTVRIWDLESGECNDILNGHTGRVFSVAYSPDGNQLASGADDATIRVWNLNIGGCQLLQKTGNAYCVTYSSDGRYFASTDGRTVQIHDLESEKCRMLQGRTVSIKSVAFSPDGSYLASGASDRTVRIWNLKSKSGKYYVLEGHVGGVFSVAYSPDGNQLASGSDDGTVRIWNSDNGDCIDVLEGHAGEFNSVAYRPDGSHIASGASNGCIRIWNLKRKKCINLQKNHIGWITSIAYSPDGTQLASGAVDGTVRIWNLDNGDCIDVLEGHAGVVNSIAYSPDGRHIAIGALSGTMLWNPKSKRTKRSMPNGRKGKVNSVAFSSDGSLLASGADDGTVQVWKSESSELIGVLSGYVDRVNCVAFSPNSSRLAIGADNGTVLIWENVSHNIVREYSIIPNLNLSGANFEDSIIEKKDKEIFITVGAKVK